VAKRKRMNRKTTLAVIGTCAVAVASAQAAAADHFEASCSDVRVEAYRYEVRLDGKTDSEWSEGEKFGQEWRFKYTGGSRAEVDGEPAVVISKAGPVLILSTGGESATASSLWLYAIHRDLKQIVAAQVNVYSGLKDGLKTRSVQLRCTFSALP
jgi:hypothetical protein